MIGDFGQLVFIYKLVRVAALHASQRHREVKVLDEREVLKQMSVRKHERRVRTAVVRRHTAQRRRVQPGQQIEQRRLAAAALARYQDKPDVSQRQARLGKRGTPRPALVNFGNVLSFQHRYKNNTNLFLNYGNL